MFVFIFLEIVYHFLFTIYFLVFHGLPIADAEQWKEKAKEKGKRPNFFYKLTSQFCSESKYQNVSRTLVHLFLHLQMASLYNIHRGSQLRTKTVHRK